MRRFLDHNEEKTETGDPIGRFHRRCVLFAAVVTAIGAAEPFGIPYPSWWNGPVPRPTENRFDRDAFERWASQQPTAVAPVVDFVRANLQVVSQKDFETELANSFESFAKIRDPKKKLLFVTYSNDEDRPKSNAWATALLREKFPGACRDAAFVNLPFPPTSGTHFEKLKTLVATGEYQVVLADDATYTGRQVLTQILPQLAKAADGIDLVIPYGTSELVDQLAKPEAKDYLKIPVRLHRTKTIPTVAELVARLPDGPRRALTGYPVHVRNLFNDNHTLTVFDHKTPDYVSFPRWLAEGHVLRKGPAGYAPMTAVLQLQLGLVGPPPTYPFLRKGAEPYRCLDDLKHLIQ